jgi:hypothetical protein
MVGMGMEGNQGESQGESMPTENTDVPGSYSAWRIFQNIERKSE